MVRSLALSALLSAGCYHQIQVKTGLPYAPDEIKRNQRVCAESDLRDSTKYAVEWWNASLEREALTLADDQCDISVVSGSFDGRLGTGNARHGLIQVRSPVDTYRIIRHELGHAAFWLDHDDNQEESVMVPSLAFELKVNPVDAWGRPILEQVAYLMPEDRAVIECRMGLRTELGFTVVDGKDPCAHE